jgi:hypothetical protein
MVKSHRVDLSEPERAILLTLIQKGRTAARQVRRAQLQLAAVDGQHDATIARVVHSIVSIIEGTRKRFVEADLDAARHDWPYPGAWRKLTGKQEALLVASACSTPPVGRTRWTMQPLADRVVELGIVEGIRNQAGLPCGQRNSALATGMQHSSFNHAQVD